MDPGSSLIEMAPYRCAERGHYGQPRRNPITPTAQQRHDHRRGDDSIGAIAVADHDGAIIGPGVADPWDHRLDTDTLTLRTAAVLFTDTHRTHAGGSRAPARAENTIEK